MKKKNTLWIALFLAPTCIIFLLVFAIPLCMVFGGSLFDYRLMPKTFSFVGLGNFVKLFTQDTGFKQILGNTVAWIGIHCVLHVALGTLLAFVLYKKPRGWKFVRVTYMIPNIISQSAIAMIFLNLYNAQYGALNSLLNAIGLGRLQHNWLFDTATAFPAVTMTWFLFAGYTTTLVLAQCLSTDETILEAARVDGATNFQIDRFVMFPIVKRMIGTTVIMAATYMLQLFSMIYITTGGGPGKTTTNLPLYLYTTMKANNYGYANTIGVVIILIGAVTMVVINRIFRMNEED
jgi:raffinose/stachyose/melibiose transport system permease protein